MLITKLHFRTVALNKMLFSLLILLSYNKNIFKDKHVIVYLKNVQLRVLPQM